MNTPQKLLTVKYRWSVEEEHLQIVFWSTLTGNSLWLSIPERADCWSTTYFRSAFNSKQVEVLIGWRDHTSDGLHPKCCTDLIAAQTYVTVSHAFLKPPSYPGRESRPLQGVAHNKITKKRVHAALFCQSPMKAPGPDKLNFKAIRLLWSWDHERIVAIVKTAIRLQYHPKSWKCARGILLEKGNKRDRTIVKSYRVISLLNCIGKLVEKVVAEELGQFCESHLNQWTN